MCLGGEWCVWLGEEWCVCLVLLCAFGKPLGALGCPDEVKEMPSKSRPSKRVVQLFLHPFFLPPNAVSGQMLPETKSMGVPRAYAMKQRLLYTPNCR